MTDQIRPFIFGVKLGIFIFPLFFVLDMFVYPEFKFKLLTIRMIISLFLAITLLVISKINKRFYLAVILTSIFLVSVSISSMCLITGDGFASSYFAGLLQIIIVTALFYNIKPALYTVIMILIVAQHFLLLSFITWQLNDLLVNIMGLGMSAIMAMGVHYFIYGLVKENQSLKGLLPICANCKKVRDDDGYWNQIELFIQERSSAEFSHGICPACAEELYGDQRWFKKMKRSK